MGIIISSCDGSHICYWGMTSNGTNFSE